MMGRRYCGNLRVRMRSEVGGLCTISTSGESASPCILIVT